MVEKNRALAWEETPVAHKSLTSLFASAMTVRGMDVDSVLLDREIEKWPGPRQKAFRRKMQEAFRLVTVEAASISDANGAWSGTAVKQAMLSSLRDLASPPNCALFSSVSLASLLEQCKRMQFVPRPV